MEKDDCLSERGSVHWFQVSVAGGSTALRGNAGLFPPITEVRPAH